MRASSREASGSSISSRRGSREQRAADGDALLLAARQPARPAARAGRRCRAARPPCRGVVARERRGREPAAVEQVLPHGQVREQPPVLEHVADAALCGGHEHAAAGVDQHASSIPHATLVGADQPGDDVDERWSCPRPSGRTARSARRRSRSAASSAKSPSRCRMSRRASFDVEPAVGAGAPVTSEAVQRQHRDRDRHQASAAWRRHPPPGTCVNV